MFSVLAGKRAEGTTQMCNAAIINIPCSAFKDVHLNLPLISMAPGAAIHIADNALPLDILRKPQGKSGEKNIKVKVGER